MPFLADNVYDNGLNYLTTNQDRIDITSQEATTYTEATSTYTLGNDTVTTGSPQDGVTDGRRVVVPAITAGSVTATGTAADWAGTDGTSELLSTGDLTASQGVTSGNTFTLDAISQTLRDAA